CVEIGHFYDGVGVDSSPVRWTPQQRLMVELARNFLRIVGHKNQAMVCDLARALAAAEPAAQAAAAALRRHLAPRLVDDQAAPEEPASNLRRKPNEYGGPSTAASGHHHPLLPSAL